MERIIFLIYKYSNIKNMHLNIIIINNKGILLFYYNLCGVVCILHCLDLKN